MNYLFQNQADQQLADYLISKALLKPEQIRHLLEDQRARFQQANQALGGLLFQIDAAGALFLTRESLRLSTLAKIELASELKKSPPSDFRQIWGEYTQLIDTKHQQLRGKLDWHENEAHGLLLSNQQTYVFSPYLVTQPFLAQAFRLYHPHLPQENQSAGPFDLFFSPRGKYLCLSDRRGGKIYVISPSTYRLIDTFTVRPPGQDSVMHLAIDEDRQFIYLTDAEPYLFVLDIESGALEQYALGDDLPSNLAYHAQDNALYLLLKEPTPQLKILDAESFETKAVQNIPYELFSRLNLMPMDLMTLAPDQESLHLLVAQPGEEEHEGWILFLDKTLQIQHKEPLFMDSLPFNLAYTVPNPIYEHTRSLKELILDAQLVPKELLDNLPLAPASGEPQSEDTPTLPYKDKSEPIKASVLFFSALEGVKHYPVPHPMETQFFPEDTIRDIMQLLTGAFYQQTGQNLNNYPEELRRFYREAQAVRLKLQDYDGTEVKIPEVLGRYDFQTFVQRDSLQLVLRLKDLPYLKYKTVPTHCPACHNPLLGLWDCPGCRLELESPERQMRRKTASIEPQHYLPADYFAVQDIKKGRLLLINTHHFKYVTWQLNLRSLPICQEPFDVLWLDKMRLLITDPVTREIFITSHTGEILWRFDQGLSAENGLHRPVKTTHYLKDGLHPRYLIVDQGNHRVLEVDPESKILWQYGQTGQAGEAPGQLNHPSDVQFTHENTLLITDTGNDRVLEIFEDRIYHSFGVKEGLKRPIYAQRLFNGHTVIADAGNFRLLEYDAQGQLKHEFVYYKPGMNPELKMEHPFRVFRRKTKTYVLVDPEKVLEIEPEFQKIVWFSRFENLSLDLTRIPQDDLPAKRELATAFDEFGPPPPPGIITLRQMLKEVPVFEGASPGFFQRIENILKFRHFEKGEKVFEKGRMARSMYFIQTGSLDVLGDDEQKPALFLNAGDSFGYMGIIFSEPRTSTIRCRENVGLYELTKKDFDRVLDDFPEIAERVKKLAAERLVVSRLKQTPKRANAESNLQALLAKHKARLQASQTQVNPERFSFRMRQSATPVDHTSHRLKYTETEAKILNQAHQQGYHCLEIHIGLNPTYRLKSARISLIAMVLDKLGTLIKTAPTPNEILEEKVGKEVIFTLVSKEELAQIVEDVQAIAEVQKVDLLMIDPKDLAPSPP